MFFLSNQQSKSGAGTRQDQASSFLRSEVLTEPISRLKRQLKKENKEKISTKNHYPVVLQMGSTIIMALLADLMAAFKSHLLVLKAATYRRKGIR